MLKKNAFSMIEVMCAICIFALAVLPMIWLGSNQTKGAYSASKHMMAGQLAASFMDNILKRHYDELKGFDKKDLNVNDPPPTELEKLFNLPELIESLNGFTNDDGIRSAEDNMKASFKNFKYSIKIEKSESAVERVAFITVVVSYRVVEGQENTRQSVTLAALKFGEKNG